MPNERRRWFRQRTIDGTEDRALERALTRTVNDRLADAGTVLQAVNQETGLTTAVLGDCRVFAKLLSF